MLIKKQILETVTKICKARFYLIIGRKLKIDVHETLTFTHLEISWSIQSDASVPSNIYPSLPDK